MPDRSHRLSSDRETRQFESGSRSSTIGGSPWPGPTRDDLLGQRARQRSVGELDPPASNPDDGSLSVPELPRLDGDVYLLEPTSPGSRSRRRTVLGNLHALALDTALSAGGDVVWVDAQGHATTHSFTRVAPSERALQRVQVARAFTTHQHHTLIEQVGRWSRGGAISPFGYPETDRPAVLVCPALDALYRAGELREGESKELLTRAVATVTAVAREHDIPVLLTRTRADSFTDPVEAAATTITLERTEFGPQFECEALDFETLVYPGDDGTVQTTFAFWRQVLGTRHPDIAGTGRETTTGPTASPVTSGGR